MERVTIVCCYTDTVQYDTLKATLAQQTIPYRLIGIDNRNNAFRSMSRAYNSVLDKLETEFVIFSHQDIVLFDSGTLERFVGLAAQTGANDLIGVAGRRPDSKEWYSNIYHGKERFAVGTADVEGLMECQTVDECFFGMRVDCIKAFPFDESTCDNWHLYAVDRCLDLLRKGNRVYVCDVALLHNSTGTLNKSFYKGMHKVCDKYRNDFAVITTTCIKCRTSPIGRRFSMLNRKIERAIDYSKQEIAKPVLHRLLGVRFDRWLEQRHARRKRL